MIYNSVGVCSLSRLGAFRGMDPSRCFGALHGLDLSRCVTRSGIDVVWVGRAKGFGAQAFSLGICHGGFVRD